MQNTYFVLTLKIVLSPIFVFLQTPEDIIQLEHSFSVVWDRLGSGIVLGSKASRGRRWRNQPKVVRIEEVTIRTFNAIDLCC